MKAAPHRESDGGLEASLNIHEDLHRASTEPLVRASRNAGVQDERVLSAIREVRRELFVPESEIADSYQDIPIRIGHHQVTTQPSLVASMVASLKLRGRERILEVGTGLGYEAAVLARLAAHVFTIERHRALAQAAERNLRRAGVSNASVFIGDGRLGLPEHAPYDAIAVAAAALETPPPLIDQLAEGGRLVQPMGPGGEEVVMVFVKRDGELRAEGPVTLAVFVPLVGE